MKRLALVLALFPCLAAAGQLSRPAAPKAVQLPLSLATAPLACGPAAAAIPAPVLSALRGGDAVAFYQAAQRAGYEAPPADDRQQTLLKEGAERLAADRAYAQLQGWLPAGPATAAVRDTKIDYDVFGRLLRRSGGLSEHVFGDVEAKRRILRQSGYKNLTGPRGVPVPIGRADAARVGRAFAHTLKTFERRAR